MQSNITKTAPISFWHFTTGILPSLSNNQLEITVTPKKKNPGAKAQQLIAKDRRHECLLYPVIVHIHAENALTTLTLDATHPGTRFDASYSCDPKPENHHLPFSRGNVADSSFVGGTVCGRPLHIVSEL
jgi:hypothetical protein